MHVQDSRDWGCVEIQFRYMESMMYDKKSGRLIMFRQNPFIVRIIMKHKYTVGNCFLMLK